MYHYDKFKPKWLICSCLVHSLRNHFGSVSALPFLLLIINNLHVNSADLQIVEGFDYS